MEYISNIIINYITNYICLENINIYKYGMQIILADISNFMVILIPSIILNKYIEGMIFFITFVGMRRYCGGYHCSTCLRCNICFMIIFLISLLSVRIPKEFINPIFIISIIYILLSVLNKCFRDVDNRQVRKNFLILIINMIVILLYVHFFSLSSENVAKFSMIMIAILLFKEESKMSILVEKVKKILWNTATKSSMNYSRYGMYEPKKPKEIYEVLNKKKTHKVI